MLAAFQQEVAALDHGDTPAGRLRQQQVDIDVLGQVDPEEVAAVRLGELTPGMCLRSDSASSVARSRRAALTVSIERWMSPEAQNWYTIACDTMLGEMYRLMAFLPISATSLAGPTR